MRDQWGMSNVLTVSVQATIYSLHERGWYRRRSPASLGSIERPSGGICCWQNQPFRPPGLKELQLDFGLGAPIDDAQGQTRRSWVLRQVLSYSRKGYSDAVVRQGYRDLPPVFGKRAAQL
jgi:hypothetical protein